MRPLCGLRLRPRPQLLSLLQGIFISRVSEEGPAAQAGVRVGDKLLEVSRQPPAPVRVKYWALGASHPGCQVLGCLPCSQFFS